jgi:hypothetical protein
VAAAWFFTLNDIDGGAVLDKDYEGNAGHALHGIFGIMGMPLLALILLIVAFFAKVPDGVKWAGFTLLAVIVQVALGLFGHGLPALGALHGINAFVVLGVALMAARRADATAADVGTGRTGARAAV